MVDDLYNIVLGKTKQNHILFPTIPYQFAARTPCGCLYNTFSLADPNDDKVIKVIVSSYIK